MLECTTAREQALDQMRGGAQSLGVDAIVTMRLTTSMIMGGSAELLAYGIAIKLL